MNEVLIAVIGSGALSAVISGVFSLVRDRQQKKNGVAAGVRMVLYDRIKHLGKQYIKNGEIAFEDLEDLLEMHKIYHDDLGGNGYLDSVMNAVKKLKTVEK